MGWTGPLRGVLFGEGDHREYRRPLSEATRTRAYVPQKLVNKLTFSRHPHRLLLHPCCLLLSISSLSTFPNPSQAVQQQYKHCHIGLCSDIIFTTCFTLPAMLSLLFFPSLFLRPFPSSHHYCLSPCPFFSYPSRIYLHFPSVATNPHAHTLVFVLMLFLPHASLSLLFSFCSPFLSFPPPAPLSAFSRRPHLLWLHLRRGPPNVKSFSHDTSSLKRKLIPSRNFSLTPRGAECLSGRLLLRRRGALIYYGNYYIIKAGECSWQE